MSIIEVVNNGRNHASMKPAAEDRALASWTAVAELAERSAAGGDTALARAKRPVENTPVAETTRPAQSGVALRFPPQSKTLARGAKPLVHFSSPRLAFRCLPTLLLVATLAFLFFAPLAHAQTTTGTNSMGPFRLNLGLETGNQPQDVDTGIKVLFTITLLTLAPSFILLMTCFTRIVIVLSFVRSALSLQGTPANQIIIGLSLFLTYFVMAPVWENIHRDAIKPYTEKRISSEDALENASKHIRGFMLKQARAKDVELFVGLARMEPTPPEKLPLKVVVPGFIISELRTAFQMGFLLFVPFILIDLVVATVLMSLGMMMMPPMTISMPLKILLFVLVDGWGLIIRSLVQSFGA